MLARRLWWRTNIKPTPARRLILLIIQPLDGNSLTPYRPTVGVELSWVTLLGKTVTGWLHQSAGVNQGCIRVTTSSKYIIFIYPVVCHRQNLDNPYMCYVFRTPLLPPPPWPIHSWFRRPKQFDLSVTSTLQSVNRWRHNEYSCCSHPSFSYPLHTHLLSRSDW